MSNEEKNDLVVLNGEMVLLHSVRLNAFYEYMFSTVAKYDRCKHFIEKVIALVS